VATARRVCVVTGTRADYGHLYWVLRELDADPRTDLQLVVTGAHLMERFGATVRQIEDDGFVVVARVPMDLSADSPLAVAGALAAATSGLADAFAQLQPDVVVLLGDRYEELAAAQAALILGIPVAHLHGGETTEGAFDEAIRHSVTKMSHLHFVAAEEYGRRVRQLGEDPARVHVVGAPGLDHLRRTELAGRDELEEFLGIALVAPVLLVTYHPETLGDDGGRAGLGALLGAIDDLGAATVVVTGVNADPGHGPLSAALHDFVAVDPARRRMVESLGQRRYLGLMAICDAVVGNSSSGLIEAPALRAPTVNVGDRQKGRLRAASVVDCGPERGGVAAALRRVLDPAFRASLPGQPSRYGIGDAAVRIREVLATTDLTGITMKHFHDWSEPS
jgi:UDP-N-acetylglucosamine 2-epimerase (non-hydrolysing)